MTHRIHRPELHFAPESGVLEAPAGVLLDGETYHLFFQYRPHGDQSSRWGHTYSEEVPFDWLECDDALAPVGGEIAVEAGSVAAVGPDTLLYYTSVTSTGSSVHIARFDSIGQICEVSDDALALDSSVVRQGQAVTDTGDFTRFRSPSVVPGWADDDRDEGHKGWIMLAMTGDSESPIPALLTSPDGITWHLEGPVEFVGDTGFDRTQVPVDGVLPPVVSPRIVRLRDEVDGRIYDVLLVTLVRSQDEISGYLVGRLEGTRFNVASPFQRLDFGHDFTRPRQTNITPGTSFPSTEFDEAVVLGLLNGARRSDDGTAPPSFSAEDWANALSLPRRLTLQNGKIFQTPPRGLPDAIDQSRRARSWIGMLEVPAGSQVTVTALDSLGNPAATITHAGDYLELDRSVSSAFDNYHAGSTPARAPIDEGDSDSLTIIVDGSTIEVFADGGQVAMASRVYFDGGCSGFTFDCAGGADVVRYWEREGS